MILLQYQKRYAIVYMVILAYLYMFGKTIWVISINLMKLLEHNSGHLIAIYF